MTRQASPMDVARLPREHQGQRTVAWWGMVCLIATEAILFAYLIFSYAYLGAQANGAWPPSGRPSLWLAAPNTAILLASSGTAEWGLRRFNRGGDARVLRIALALTCALGAVFLAVQGLEWRTKPFALDADAYSAAYFTTTGVHMAHVAAGLLALATLLAWSLMGRLTPPSQRVALGVLYWHFVDAVWLVVFTSLYLLPYLS